MPGRCLEKTADPASNDACSQSDPSADAALLNHVFIGCRPGAGVKLPIALSGNRSAAALFLVSLPSCDGFVKHWFGKRWGRANQYDFVAEIDKMLICLSVGRSLLQLLACSGNGLTYEANFVIYI